MGFTKLHISRQLLASNEFHGDRFNGVLLKYFPLRINELFNEAVLTHQLRREIIITEIVNQIVNRSGVISFFRLAAATDKPYEKIALVLNSLYEYLGNLHHRLRVAGMPCAIQYEYSCSLEESIYHIALKALADESALEKLWQAGPDIFTDLLETAAAHIEESSLSSFKSLVSKHKPGRDLEEKAEQGFRRALALEDAYDFIQHARLKTSNEIMEYMKLLQVVKFNTLKLTVRELGAESSWEHAFSGRIQQNLMQAAIGLMAQSKKNLPLAAQAVREVELLEEEGSLSLASIFEIVEQLNNKMVS
jgi:NAD-specific glutamate dehydrogenase